MKPIIILFIALLFFSSCEEKTPYSTAIRNKRTNKDSLMPMSAADSAKLEEYTSDNNQEHHTYVISERCKVYDDTSMKKVIASLPFATPIKLLGYNQNVTSKVTKTWQHNIAVIRFWDGKDSTGGYVYETDLSFFAAKASDGNLILSGFDNFETEPLTAKLLVVDSLAHVIEKASVRIIGDAETSESGARIFTYYTEGKIITDHKTSGFTDVISLYVYYPACGYLSEEYFFNYHQQKLQPITICPYVSEAGFFNSRSYLIFPDEPNGKPNSILKVQRTIEYEINDQGNMNVLNEDSSLVQLNWDTNKGLVNSDTLFSNFDR